MTRSCKMNIGAINRKALEISRAFLFIAPMFILQLRVIMI